MKIWDFVKAETFFAHYLPHIKSYKFKIREKNSRNNSTSFSKAEVIEINKALCQLVKDNKLGEGDL